MGEKMDLPVDDKQSLTLSKGVIDPEIIKALYNEQIEEQEAAVQRLRELLATAKATEANSLIDAIIQAGVIPRLVEYLHMDNRSLQLEAAWALTNIVVGTSQQTQVVINAGAVPVLIRLLHSKVEDIQDNAVCALGNIAGDSPKNRDLVLGAGIFPILLRLMCRCASLTITRNAIRCLSNLCRGDNPKPDFSKVVIDCSALPSLLQLLGSTKESIREDACWIISNICCGNQNQIQNVIDCNITPVLINILETPESEIKTKMWAAWAICNATSRGRPQQIRLLVNQNCIPPLCDLLIEKDSEVVQAVLKSLEKILNVGESDAKLGNNDNIYAFIIEEFGGLDNIKLLKIHENHEICQKAYAIIEHFFGKEENRDQLMSPD